MNDYSSAITHEQQCSPAYGVYLKSFLVPSPGDWPSWYHIKKLIIIVSAPEQSPLLSLIPEQGPFHVTLNAYETAVELHRFFFAELHKLTSVSFYHTWLRHLNWIIFQFLSLPLVNKTEFQDGVLPLLCMP